MPPPQPSASGKLKVTVKLLNAFDTALSFPTATMLKALELIGFKSFADRTRFEFPAGITAVVGPNGSGKSNIVDAIKWALGEQSVKSLRGKEMADVIFNGSGTRKPMNSAEITLTFDNATRRFPIDQDEIHITRRVYRSGEGEYLINRNPARLRDIRDLLTGTGLGAHAYSVIEQGKVDSLLQSSPKDRRIIFEEAAGISRFKMRKVEAIRRLERVAQNLLRLRDIVDEVDNRLRGVRTQAAKARRYKEHADRLQELRTQVALVDWRRLTEKLDELEREIQMLSSERDVGNASAESLETKLLEIDARLSDINETIRLSESRIASTRERIAAGESSIEHERRRGDDLDQEIVRLRKQWMTLCSRSGDLELQWSGAADERVRAESDHCEIARNAAEAERQLTETIASLDQLRAENEQRRTDYMQRMRDSAALGNETGSLETQVSASSAAVERCHLRLEEGEKQIESLRRGLKTLLERRQSESDRSDERQIRLTEADDERNHLKNELESCRKRLGEQRERLSAVAERIAVLEDFVRRQEGVSTGVKDVLARAANPEDVPFRSVLGLVADLLNVSVEAASLIEIALGPASQHIVATPTRKLLDFVYKESQNLGGRVGFIWFDPRKEEGFIPPPDLEGKSGVLGRADRFVETQSPYGPLAQRLLGRTWIVQTLQHAIPLFDAAQAVSFLTLSGDFLQADGTLLVGPRHASSGIIARRSELRALKTQSTEMQTSLGEAEAARGRIEENIKRQEETLTARRKEYEQTASSLAELQMHIAAAQERLAQLEKQRTAHQSEWNAARDQRENATQRLEEAKKKRREIDEALAETERMLARLAERIDQAEKQRVAHNRIATERKIELAKSEERMRNLESRLHELDENRQERRKAALEIEEQLAASAGRAEASRWAILKTESEIAELYLRKENDAVETVALINSRESLRAARNDLAAEAHAVRVRLRKLEDKLHGQDLAANEVRLERTGLAERYREEYGIELASIESEPVLDDPQKRETVQAEIDELRQKLNAIGNVNLEALDELDQLESRHKNLFDQYNDLTEAQKALEKIIEKINVDSRRLFIETLDIVRGHFQQLFRDLFGGGHADIVLEEGVDILESGIEIVARPPGKEPRSISLLSGGEKTMTCVAMLLAIFRSRPSPFCLLDEVDAALDEANIDRFCKVLDGFLDWTQFIIVTHSKRTMTCANTIYGVTMQESGISKQVSVRFEDVSEDGRILTPKDDAPHAQAA